VDLLISPIFSRRLVSGGSLPDQLPDQLIATVWKAFAPPAKNESSSLLSVVFNKERIFSMAHSVLVAGATGMLGSKIAHALLEKNVEVMVLTRSLHPSSPKSAQHLAQLQSRGAQVVEGDLNNMESLLKATEGAPAVISAVQGEFDIIVQGQQNLLRAAEKNGVRRFVPSDFSKNYFKLAEGDNDNSDIRRQFAELLKASPVAHTFMLNGAFTEVEVSPWGGLIDQENSTFSYWGDGETSFDITTIHDTARYTAEAVFDPVLANQVFEVAGDVLTMKEFLAIYQETTGRHLTERRLGSVQELKDWIEQKKRTASSPHEYLGQQYHYALVSGKGKLDNLQNDRYPDIQPLTLNNF
jgi:uncharacterized protein YbjT (DUF2867 family)